MDQSSVEAKFTLRLVVDEEKKKVVFAEACRDFVDVLFSFLTLPMGTIVRLLEEHRKSESVTVGCFRNLYRSVVDMGIDDFETEACKQMLLYPRSVRDVHCKRLKINLHPTEGDKYFKCPTYLSCKMCSNFSTSLCKCGVLMSEEFQLTMPNVEDKKQNDANGVFVRGKSSFIITDDLQVAVMSTDLVLKKLKSQGCGDFRKVQERLVDIGLEEVLTLLETIFSSETPLTDMFLNKKQSPQGLMKTCETLGPLMKRKRDESEPGVITLSAIMRKQDMKVLYAECRHDFVDLLFTFLVVPLDSVLEISGNVSTYGFIGNLFGSFKNLSCTEVSASKSVLPHYYRCQKLLPDIITEQPMKLVLLDDTKEPVVLIDPKSHGNDQSIEDKGLVKRNTKFTVTDDLIITPMTSSSAFCFLKKLQIRAEDLEVQEITITKTEASNLLRASLMTSSALNTALWNLTLKKPKKET